MNRSLIIVKNVIIVVCMAFFASACGGGFETGRQYCPPEGILADTERMSFIPTGKAGAVQAEILGVELECSWHEEQLKLLTNLSVRGVVMSQTGTTIPLKISLPVFVVIIDENDKILVKQDFEIKVSAKKGKKLIGFTQDGGALSLNLTKENALSDYTILVGFRITPEQWQQNRSARRKKLNL